tara:strand:+ start:473 stop:820 length:348 start_codon:yes stop_codon:yes gene_type:complete
MDERLEKALEFSNFIETQNNQKNIFFKQFQEDCVYYKDGTKFSVTKELIAFLSAMANLKQEGLVLLDDNNIPIQIDNVDEFQKNICSVYLIAARKYFKSYDSIKLNRSVEGLTTL